MRFMILRKADKQTAAGVMPSRQLLEAMGAYMGEMTKAGVILAGDGLKPTAKGARVKFRRGKPTVTDGPFTESKEVIAGYCLIQVASLQEAIDWVKRWPALDADGEVEIEIRPLYEADDFGAEFTPELREAEERMRVEAAKTAAKAGKRK